MDQFSVDQLSGDQFRGDEFSCSRGSGSAEKPYLLGKFLTEDTVDGCVQ